MSEEQTAHLITVQIKKEAHVCELLDELKAITDRMKEIVQELGGGLALNVEDIDGVSVHDANVPWRY